MKKTLTLSLALLALASLSWAAINLNSSRSNIYRVFYNGTLMSQAQADALLSDMDKIGPANEASLKQWLPANLEKHGVKAAAVTKTIIRPADKKHKETTIILLMKGDDEASAIALIDAPAAAAGVPPVTRERLQPQKRRMWCRDPAAQSLTFQILSRGLHRTEGRIRITGVVKNVGDAVFESDPRQATVAIYETPPGVRGTIKAEQTIARLEPNGTITLNFERDWSIATEFPPTFLLLISYDPDIYLDGNKNNDDCGRNNNRKELTGAELNRQWLVRDSAKKP